MTSSGRVLSKAGWIVRLLPVEKLLDGAQHNAPHFAFLMSRFFQIADSGLDATLKHFDQEKCSSGPCAPSVFEPEAHQDQGDAEFDVEIRDHRDAAAFARENRRRAPAALVGAQAACISGV